jgi:hypothetical protein
VDLKTKQAISDPTLDFGVTLSRTRAEARQRLARTADFSGRGERAGCALDLATGRDIAYFYLEGPVTSLPSPEGNLAVGLDS